MANSGSENFGSGRNFSPRTINEHVAIGKGRSHRAGVFFWKRDLHGKLSKKSECTQKNENFDHENTAKRKRESASTGRMMFDLLGNIRKHLGIEKLSTRKSRQKVHDVQRVRVESDNETQLDDKERLVLDGFEAIRTVDSARCASETTDSQEESCSDQQLDCAEELSNRTEGELARDLAVATAAAADGGDNCSERDYVASNESKAKANLTEELLKLSRYGWYWGPISGDEADAKLISEPDGAFLVRDSSDDRYLLTLSFKSSGKLLHARMEHSGGLFSLCNHGESEGFTSVAELIDHSMNFSQSAVFCYSRPKYPGYPSFPVRLTKPVSRFTRVRSLQYLCRFVIRQNTRLDNIRKLPLPTTIRGYIEEAHF